MLKNLNYTVKKNTSNLKLDIEIIDNLINLDNEIITREVVRGISIKDNKILLIYPKDEEIYGTPGGGIEAGEDRITALKREMLEEVGAKKLNIKEYLGVVKSFRKNFEEDSIFNPIHHYFLVDIFEYTEPQLIEYEAELGLTNKYMNIDEAIQANIKAINDRKSEHLDFYTNQTIMLKELKALLKL